MWTFSLAPAGMVWLFPAAHTDCYFELERAGPEKAVGSQREGNG